MSSERRGRVQAQMGRPSRSFAMAQPLHRVLKDFQYTSFGVAPPRRRTLVPAASPAVCGAARPIAWLTGART